MIEHGVFEPLLILAVLFHPKKDIYLLSGTSFFSRRDLFFHTLQVPWDKNMGIAQGKEFKEGHPLLATALPHIEQSRRGRRRMDRLMGLLVHTSCWELLCSRKSSGKVILWANLKRLVRALRRKSARDWKGVDESFNLVGGPRGKGWEGNELVYRYGLGKRIYRETVRQKLTSDKLDVIRSFPQ